MNYFSKIFIYFFTFFLCFQFLPLEWVEAAQVLKVKGRKLLIDSEGVEFKVGDKAYIIRSDSGKRVGLVKVLKVKEHKAIGIMTQKSRAEVGWEVVLKEQKELSQGLDKGSLVKPEMGEEENHQRRGRELKNQHWGVLVGVSIYSMSVVISSGDEKNEAIMSGNGLSLKGVFDYRLFSSIWLRGLVGIDQLITSSLDNFCGLAGNEPCKVNINYFSADSWAKWVISKGASPLWLGAGISILYPILKETTALEESSITTTMAFLLGGGVDWSVGNMIIPVSVQYLMFPPSDNVSVNAFSLSVGTFF